MMSHVITCRHTIHIGKVRYCISPYPFLSIPHPIHELDSQQRPSRAKDLRASKTYNSDCLKLAYHPPLYLNIVPTAKTLNRPQNVRCLAILTTRLSRIHVGQKRGMPSLIDTFASLWSHCPSSGQVDLHLPSHSPASAPRATSSVPRVVPRK